eukprot:8133756-Pyramimonas_sp.AAC.1
MNDRGLGSISTHFSAPPRAWGAQPATRQDDQLQVSPAGATSTASPAGTAAQSPSDAGGPVGLGTAKSSIKNRARPVEPVRVLTVVSPTEHWEKAIKERCPENKSTPLGKKRRKYPPAGPDGVRRWLVKLPHQSTIGATEGVGGGSARVISQKPLNGGQLAKR